MFSPAAVVLQATISTPLDPWYPPPHATRLLMPHFARCLIDEDGRLALLDAPFERSLVISPPRKGRSSLHDLGQQEGGPHLKTGSTLSIQRNSHGEDADRHIILDGSG